MISMSDKSKELKERVLHKCLRCGHKWLSYDIDPVTCASCRSPYWNKERVEQ